MPSRRYLTPSAASQDTATTTTNSSWKSFQKLFASVADLQTKNNHARHLALTKNILYENELGWKVGELPLVNDMLHLLCKKVLDGVPQFDGQLVLAVMQCCKPFIRQKSNEEITNPNVFYELLPTLGKLLSFGNIQVQIAAAEVLRTFSIGACLPRMTPKKGSTNGDNKTDDLRVTPRVFSQNLLKQTGTVDAVVAVLHELFSDEDAESDEQGWVQEGQSMENAPNITENTISTEQEFSLQDDSMNAREPADEAMMEEREHHTTPLQQSQEQLASEAKECPAEMKNLQKNGALQRATSAPTSCHKCFFHHSDDTINGAYKEGNLPALSRATRSFSAPTVLYCRTHTVCTDDATVDSSSIAQQNPEDTLEQGDCSAIQPDSLSEQEPCQAHETAKPFEEELLPRIDSVLPIQLRLSTLVFPLLDLLHELSAFQGCAEVLVGSGALQHVVFILNSITDSQDELLPMCLNILWNILELRHEKVSTTIKCTSRTKPQDVFQSQNASLFLKNEFTYQALLHVLELLTCGYRQHDKEMRNECLVILQMLAKRQCSLDFFHSTGLTVCLFLYATSAELSRAKQTKNSPSHSHQNNFAATPPPIPVNDQYYASNSDEDFEFKRMLWILLADISCNHDANLSELTQFRLVEIWLSYATISIEGVERLNTSSQTSALKYSTQQFQLLQELSLSVLNLVAPFVIDHMYEIGGHSKLLEFLQLNTGAEDILASAWILMLQVSPPLPLFQAELGKLGVIETCMSVFEGPSSPHTFAIRRNAILVCANMCRNGNGRNYKRFRRANGVYCLVQHLKFDPSYSILEKNILVGVLDAVRSCVIGDIENETIFINDDGVGKLLSVLESAPKALKHQALAALAEVCVNPAATPSYQAWRSDGTGGDSNARAIEVLLRLYANEEAAEKGTDQDPTNAAIQAAPSSNDIVVPFDDQRYTIQAITSSLIVGPESTTLGEASPSLSYRPESPAFARLKDALKAAQGFAHSGRSTRCVMELKNHEIHPEVNLKAKIHLILANMSVPDNLKPQDQAIFAIAKEYSTFKLGEMWQNVERSLHIEGIRPIFADALYIQKNVEHAYNISMCTKAAQQEAFSRAHSLSIKHENAFFEQILRHKHQEAQAKELHCANRCQKSIMQLHLDAKNTRQEHMRQRDPALRSASKSKERILIRDPPPEREDEDEGMQSRLIEHDH